MGRTIFSKGEEKTKENAMLNEVFLSTNNDLKIHNLPNVQSKLYELPKHDAEVREKLLRFDKFDSISITTRWELEQQFGVNVMERFSGDLSQVPFSHTYWKASDGAVEATDGKEVTDSVGAIGKPPVWKASDAIEESADDKAVKDGIEATGKPDVNELNNSI